MKRKTQIWLAAILLTLSACNNSNSRYHSKMDTTNMNMRHDTTGVTPNDTMNNMRGDTTRH
jgi:hypothetical protein